MWFIYDEAADYWWERSRINIIAGGRRIMILYWTCDNLITTASALDPCSCSASAMSLEKIRGLTMEKDEFISSFMRFERRNRALSQNSRRDRGRNVHDEKEEIYKLAWKEEIDQLFYVWEWKKQSRWYFTERISRNSIWYFEKTFSHRLLRRLEEKLNKEARRRGMLIFIRNVSYENLRNCEIRIYSLEFL